MPEKTEQPSSTALAERDTTANPLALVDSIFEPEEVQAIAKFIGVSADDSAFRPYLAVAASLGLSPLNGEIWLIKGRRKNPDTEEWEDFYRPAVGRDGFLRKAEESSLFKGIRSGTVCANDTFEVEDDGEQVKMVHRFKSLGPDAPKGKEARYRGAVVGAWAKLFFSDGRPPIFYYAPAHEHVKTKVKNGNVEFEGAWSYTSAMCEKAAQSRVLRLGFRVGAGVVPVDELRADDPQMVASSTNATDADGGSIADDPDAANVEYIESLELVSQATQAELMRALEALNELIPFSWTPAKLRMRLGSDCDDEKAQAVLAEVEAEFKAAREREVEVVAEAIEVVEALEAKPPFDLRVPPAADREEDWLRVVDVLVDEDTQMVTFALSDGGEKTVPAVEEVELRRVDDEG